MNFISIDSKLSVALLIVFIICAHFTLAKHIKDRHHPKNQKHKNSFQSSKPTPKAYHFPPRLIIFDLDSLMWPFWIGTELQPPVVLRRNHTIVDARGLIIRPYPQVDNMLNFLNHQGYRLAVVGRTGNEVLSLLKWEDKFKYKEIYPGPKTKHITKLQQITKINFREMIYFGYDTDETREVENKLSTVSCIIDRGMNMDEFANGMVSYAKKNRIALPKVDSLSSLDNSLALQALGDLDDIDYNDLQSGSNLNLNLSPLIPSTSST